MTFLPSYGRLFAPACPKGRSFIEDKFVRYIDTSVSKDGVYKLYEAKWIEMVQYMIYTNMWK